MGLKTLNLVLKQRRKNQNPDKKNFLSHMITHGSCLNRKYLYMNKIRIFWFSFFFYFLFLNSPLLFFIFSIFKIKMTLLTISTIFCTQIPDTGYQKWPDIRCNSNHDVILSPDGWRTVLEATELMDQHLYVQGVQENQLTGSVLDNQSINQSPNQSIN